MRRSGHRNVAAASADWRAGRGMQHDVLTAPGAGLPVSGCDPCGLGERKAFILPILSSCHERLQALRLRIRAGEFDVDKVDAHNAPRLLQTVALATCQNQLSVFTGREYKGSD